MKKILLVTFAAFWMLMGCNSSSKNTGACANYDNQTLCSTAKYNNSGCYWAAPAASAQGPTGCIAVSDCGQPTTKSACEATSQAGTQCTWDGSACFLKSASSKCSDFTSKDNCLGTWAGDGYCTWNATSNACSIATSCSDIQDQATCSGATVATKACTWTPTAAACSANNPATCTHNKISSGFVSAACCAGTDDSCIFTDSSCNSPDSNDACSVSASFVCTLDTTKQFCCSGTKNTCSYTNPNCTFVATAGSCS